MLPLPTGWYALAARSEVPPGAVLTRRLGATERVLFRDAAGGLAVVDPYCPHLGAHLGRGGVVDGEVIVCPFHGLRFDRSGACVATPTGHRPPRTARLATYPVVESGGWVFSWLDPQGGPPTWTPPVLEEDGWGTLRTHAVELRTHPQETTENSVDLGHFPIVQGYRDVRLLASRPTGRTCRPGTPSSVRAACRRSPASRRSTSTSTCGGSGSPTSTCRCRRSGSRRASSCCRPR